MSNLPFKTGPLFCPIHPKWQGNSVTGDFWATFETPFGTCRLLARMDENYQWWLELGVRWGTVHMLDTWPVDREALKVTYERERKRLAECAAS